jgi:hypothetical protein
MKIKKGYTLTHVGNEHIILPSGDDMVRFDQLIHINDIGCFLFEKLLEDITIEDLLGHVLSEYDIDEATARNDVEAFINQLQKQGILDE